MPINVLLNGARGRMGLAISEVAPQQGAHIAYACDAGDDPATGIDNCEVIIDFSFHEVTPIIAELAVAKKIPLVIGTTGHSPEERQTILAVTKGKIPLVWAGNYSIGVNTLNYLTRKAAPILSESFEAEVLELHHHDKKDAPSGTAARLIEILQSTYKLDDSKLTHGREGIVGARPSDEIGIHAIRGGDIVGEHTVYFCGQGERIELTHRATDRRIFARGALHAARWALKQQPGLYDMEAVLGLTD
ncbi:MAG: 4-hydroxy-tetrahydrodipicolinate reductase [Opitutia bacterium UBA7350]|nr:MAG: 4-hydroxy-tetrahydrodipicolinate reductase [Opitutae bacterium UBA7350]